MTALTIQDGKPYVVENCPVEPDHLKYKEEKYKGELTFFPAGEQAYSNAYEKYQQDLKQALSNAIEVHPDSVEEANQFILFSIASKNKDLKNTEAFKLKEGEIYHIKGLRWEPKEELVDDPNLPNIGGLKTYAFLIKDYKVQEEDSEQQNCNAFTDLNADNPENLTHIWNLAINEKLTPYETNDVWKALRILDKHGLCTIDSNEDE